MGEARAVDGGQRDRGTTADAQRITDAEREARESIKANEILVVARVFAALAVFDLRSRV